MSPVVEDVRGKRIRVFRNGDMYDAGKRLVINPRVYRNYEQFLSRITAEINLVTGAARRVYTLDGQPLHTLDDIKDGSIYVATSGEHLKRIPYLITTDPTLAAISSSNIRGGPGRASGVGVRDRGLSVAASDVDEDERAATEAAQRPAYLRASYSRKRPSAWGAGAVNQRFGTSRVVKAADEGKQAEKERPLFGPTSKAYRVTVFVNGEATTPGTSLVLNYRNCKTYEQLLRNLTDNLQISVRKLYDAETGHRISSLRQLHEHQNIVASVSDGFKPVAYLIEHFNRGKDPRGEDEGQRVVTFFPNGDTLHLGQNVTVTRKMFPTLQRLIDHLNHKIRLITGSIHKLYTLSGERITTIDALEHQHGYVVVAKDDPFIRAQYNLNAIVPLEHPERSVAGSAAVKKIRRRKGEEGSAGGSRVGSEKGERKVKRRKKKVKAKEGHIEEEEHQHEPVHEEGHAKSPQQHREEDHPPAERKIVYTKPTIKPAVAAAPVVPAPAHAGTTFLTEPAHPPQPQYSTRDLPIVAPPPAPQHELKPTAEHRDIKEHAHHADTDGDGDEPPPQGFFRHLGQKVDQMLDGDDSPSPVHGEKKAQNPQDRKHRKKRPDTDQEYDSGDEPPSSDHAEKTKTTTKSTQKLNTTLAKSRDEIRADATESVRKSRAALRSGGSGGDHESSTTTHTTTAKLATTRKPTKTESKRHHRASSVPSSDGEDNRDSRKDEVETDPEPDDANEVYGDSQLRELKSTTGGKTVRRVRRVRRKGGDDEGEEEEEEGEEVEVGQSEGGGKTGKVTTTRKIRDGRRRTTRKQGGGGASDDDDNDEEDASDTDPRTHAKYTTTTTTRTETSTPNSKLPGAAKGKNGFRLFGGKKNNNEGSGVESGDEGRSVGGSEYDGEEGRGSEVKEKTAAAGLPGLPRKKNVL